MTEKILIIDDDIDTLKLVGLMLERQGYQIAVASNGTIGLSKAASEQPDLILLDVMMPDMDGYQVTERLRSDPSLAHIPIVMFTAKTMVDDKVKGFESGVDDYLTKPSHPAELTAHVKAVLSRSVATPATQAPEQAQIISFFGNAGRTGDVDPRFERWGRNAAKRDKRYRCRNQSGPGLNGLEFGNYHSHWSERPALSVTERYPSQVGRGRTGYP